MQCGGCGKIGVGVCNICIARLPLAVPPETPNAFAVYDYSNRIVWHAVRSLKYYGKSEEAFALAYAAAPHISEWVGDTLQSNALEELVLIPIPQHSDKYRERGFNHSEQIAKIIAPLLGSTTIKNVLKKEIRTLQQAHVKSKKLRLENIKRSMTATPGLNPKTIYIVVDDVTTTGATFLEAKRALSEAGAKKMLFVALAHGYASKRL